MTAQGDVTMQGSIQSNGKTTNIISGPRKAINIAIVLGFILIAIAVISSSPHSDAYEKGRNLGRGVAYGVTERDHQQITEDIKLRFTDTGEQFAVASGYKRGSKEANEFCDGFDCGWHEWLNHVRR